MRPVIQLPLPHVPPQTEPSADAELLALFRRAHEAWERWKYRPQEPQPRRAA